MKTRKISFYRRWVTGFEILLPLALPFLFIHGESVLRFDVPTLVLHVFGFDVWIEDFFLILLAIMFLVFSFCLMTSLFGRIWCGWLCPQTLLCGLGTSGPAVAAISVLLSFTLLWYVISPYDFWNNLQKGTLGSTFWMTWTGLVSIFFVDLFFLRQTFCTSLCPYAKLQSVLLDEATLTIAFDSKRAKECVDCRACVRECPIRLDLRLGQSSDCLHCAECVDQCSDIMAKQGKEPLIDYAWGAMEGKKKPFRAQVLLFGSFTLISLALLIFFLLRMTPFEMLIQPNPNFSPFHAANQKMVQSVLVSLQNKTGGDLRLKSTTNLAAMGVRVSPESVVLPKGRDVRRIPFFFSYDPQLLNGETQMDFSLDSSHPLATITRRISLKNAF